MTNNKVRAIFWTLVLLAAFIMVATAGLWR
jgi:hypothetical protein